MRPAGLLPGSLTAHRSRQLASLHSVQGAHPLHRSAAIPLTSLHRFLPAGHAKHGATPSGVFDWTQSGQSGAWGNPNKAHREIQKDIPMPCLLILSEIFDKKWTWVGAVPIDHPVSFPQKSRCHSDIMDIGSGGLYRVDKATPGVHACVALHAKMGLLTKSSLEEFSRFMCADYDVLVRECPLFRTFEKNDF